MCLSCAFFVFANSSVVHEEGTEGRIDHWINKMWKLGGSLTTPLRQKLEFLYANGRQEQVGMFLRKQNVVDPQLSVVYAKRGDWERTHNHIKSIMKFDVRRLRNEIKRLYVLANFVVYQILLKGHLQNKIFPVQQFKYIKKQATLGIFSALTIGTVSTIITVANNTNLFEIISITFFLINGP
jgi:hypothetical protein